MAIASLHPDDLGVGARRTAGAMAGRDDVAAGTAIALIAP